MPEKPRNRTCASTECRQHAARRQRTDQTYSLPWSIDISWGESVTLGKRKPSAPQSLVTGRDSHNFLAGQDFEDFSHLIAVFHRMSQWQLWMELVAISAAFTSHGQITALHEVGDDALCGAFGDADQLRQVAMSNPGITSYTQQRMGVVGEEGPVRHFPTLPEKASSIACFAKHDY